MSITIPSWLVVTILASSAWFIVSAPLWRLGNGVSRLQNRQRKGSVVKTWPEVLAFVTVGPVGWCILAVDRVDTWKVRKHNAGWRQAPDYDRDWS